MSVREALEVALSGEPIGELRPDGSFVWAGGWERFAPLNAPVLSCSLPFGAEGQDPAPFFGGLLPEGVGLAQLAREARVTENDLFGLLAEVGADVGGAVTIGEPHPPVDPIPIEETEYDRILERAYGYLRGAAVGGGGSAATGVQQKVSLTLGPEGGWMIGRGSTPSTHLLKPVPREYGERLRAEAHLNLIAREIGLARHEARVESAGEREVLVVERYDREIAEDGTPKRVHQEDAAQALGLPWGGNSKYENVDPRASLSAIAGLLPRRGTVFQDGADERERLLQLVVLNIVAGNTDAHAKNYSLLLPRLGGGGEDRVRLADAYDIVPQVLFTAEPDPLAMRIGGQSTAGAVRAEDIVAEARSWGVAGSRAEAVVSTALERITAALERIGTRGGVPPRVPAFLSEQVENLRSGDPAWTRRNPPALALR